MDESEEDEAAVDPANDVQPTNKRTIINSVKKEIHPLKSK